MINILWADDEIDMLKPHIIFLEQKGYVVTAVKSGNEALDKMENEHFDLIFLDENMPGLSGLETLTQMKITKPHIPVVMITKNEAESIMEEAIGSKIADYLIKPVNPNQILLSIKKNMDRKRLVSAKTTTNYQQEFRKISMRLSENLDKEDWKEVFKQINYWELEIDRNGEESMAEILAMQKTEANMQFFRFVKDNYKNWINAKDAPLMSHHIMSKKVFPYLNSNSPLYFVLIDNLRFDQWKVIEPMILQDFNLLEEHLYFSILPTATQYARNAIFSGLLPLEMEKRFPSKWKNDEDEGGKNLFEEDFLKDQLNRFGKSDLKMSYTKIVDLDFGKKIASQMANQKHNQLNVIVYNFVDMLSHARTDMKLVKELAEDDAAYRSLTLSWFEHSPLRDILKAIAKQGAKLILTTDHGTINVKRATKIIGERNVNSNLRYKQGRNMNYNDSDVFVMDRPSDFYLPLQNISGKYIFAKEDFYFVYPNNFNQFVQYFKNTYQHGGISLEEMLIPIVTLQAK